MAKSIVKVFVRKFGETEGGFCKNCQRNVVSVQQEGDSLVTGQQKRPACRSAGPVNQQRTISLSSWNQSYHSEALD